MAPSSRPSARVAAFLALPVLLIGALSEAQAWDWRGRVFFGPPYDSDAAFRNFPPDAAPPPPQSYDWPTLREALQQYGWFGRRACKGCPAEVPFTGEALPPSVPGPPPGAPAQPTFPEIETAPMPAPSLGR